MPEQACPHVNTAMIAAGFFKCAMCENDPQAPAGFLVDDTSRQEAALARAYNELHEALMALASEADTGARACKRKRPAPDMNRIDGAVLDMQRARDEVDRCTIDLQGAKGHDL